MTFHYKICVGFHLVEVSLYHLPLFPLFYIYRRSNNNLIKTIMIQSMYASNIDFFFNLHLGDAFKRPVFVSLVLGNKSKTYLQLVLVLCVYVDHLLYSVRCSSVKYIKSLSVNPLSSSQK